jgi:hypothetical protein
MLMEGEMPNYLTEEFPDEVIFVIRPFLFEAAGPFCPIASLGRGDHPDAR